MNMGYEIVSQADDEVVLRQEIAHFRLGKFAYARGKTLAEAEVNLKAGLSGVRYWNVMQKKPGTITNDDLDYVEGK